MEEISLEELFKFFLSKIKFISISVLLFIILGVIYVYVILTPMYHSSTTLILVSDNTNQNSTMLQSEVNLNKNLVTTYSEIVKSRAVLDQVIEQLKLSETVEELSEKIEVSSIENTEIIKIQVSNENSEQAKKIAESTAETFKKEVQEIYNLTNVSVVDNAIVEEEPYNVSPLKQISIFGTLGLLTSLVVFFLIFYFDTTIKSASDIEEKLDLVVIGNVCLVDKNKGE